MDNRDRLSEQAKKEIREKLKEKSDELTEKANKIVPQSFGSDVVASTPWTQFSGEEFDDFRIELRKKPDNEVTAAELDEYGVKIESVDDKTDEVTKSLMEQVREFEESKIRENIRDFYGDRQVEFIEDMIEAENYDRVRDFFDSQDIFIRFEMRHGAMVKKLYIQDSLADVWVV